MSSEPNNERVYAALMEIKQDIGEIKAGVKANHEFTIAVNEKATRINDDLAAHKIETEAHGIKSERATMSRLAGMIVAGFAIVEGAYRVAMKILEKK